METQINQLHEEIKAYPITPSADPELFRKRFLGRKGVISALFKTFASLPSEEKKSLGKALNTLKKTAQEHYQALQQAHTPADQSLTRQEDITLPPPPEGVGARHPITNLMREAVDLLVAQGFALCDGPEIEDDWHNFVALNFPEDHPARDMQDTFFLDEKKKMLLRTHTSSVQVRIMQEQTPPLRVVLPGRVFRNEAISARAHCAFHQVEGLYLDKKVSFADLKATLSRFLRQLFTPDTQTRWRPSFFPFTEPSAEIDISCQLCQGKGCQLCKYTGWVEVAGAGMVDPAVLKHCGVDVTLFGGYAFGLGLERLAMLRYQIDDLRLFWQNDVRFLRQFSGIV